MEVDLGDKKVVALLKFYLGRFFVRTPSVYLDRFKKEFRDYGSVIATGDADFLRYVGCYFLLYSGRKTYREMTTYDLIETYLGRQDEGERFYDIETELLVLTHLRTTMENRQLENLVVHTMGQREMMGKKTLVLLEEQLPQVMVNARELKYQVVDQRQGVGSTQVEM